MHLHFLQVMAVVAQDTLEVAEDMAVVAAMMAITMEEVAAALVVAVVVSVSLAVKNPWILNSIHGFSRVLPI